MGSVSYIADHLAKKASRPAAQSLGVGDTIENGALRVHRFCDVIELWDLTNAGKRGRKVSRLSASPVFRNGVDRELVLEQTARQLERLSSFADARLELEASNVLSLSYAEERGVDVAPAGFKTLRLETSRVSVEAEYNGFRIRDLTDPDTQNRQTCIPAERASIPKFYRWVGENLDRIPAMSFYEILAAMRAQGICYDTCTND